MSEGVATRRATVPIEAVLVGLLAAACGGRRLESVPSPGGRVSTSPAASPASVPATPSPTPSPSPQPTRGPAASPIQPPAFSGTVSIIDPKTRAGMVSWHSGCPVPIDDLRLLSLSYWGFDDRPHVGQMILNAGVAWTVVRAFHSLYDARFPIRRMELVDNYGADDERSMTADNTSGFNCRGVPGSSTWSQHAYGRAIDINPLENPEIRDGVVDPPAAAPFAERSKMATGMIHPGDTAVRAFAAIGWFWGGYWRSLQDYQHFSSNGL